MKLATLMAVTAASLSSAEPSTDRLAYVVYTITEPAEYRGHEFQTLNPARCKEHISRVLELLVKNGFAADARCHYTNAPASSPRPKPNPRKEE